MNETIANSKSLKQYFKGTTLSDDNDKRFVLQEI